MKVTDLKSSEYYDYYQIYLSAVPKNLGLIEAYRQGSDDMLKFLESIPQEKWQFSYGPGKWTIAAVVQHIIDTERIFMHRCFRIARGETNNISGFDQDAYVPTSGAERKSPANLIAEYKGTRQFSISILESLIQQDLNRMGSASGHPLSAASAAFIVVGHEIWHAKIINDRYLGR